MSCFEPRCRGPIGKLHERGAEVTQVVHAENGRAGIEMLQKTPGIDGVLMDIMMPEMDGYETMRAIRQIAEFRSLPIIAVTAKAMKGDRAKCIEAGASDYIVFYQKGEKRELVITSVARGSARGYLVRPVCDALLVIDPKTKPAITRFG